jgi:hypothetical protein
MVSCKRSRSALPARCFRSTSQYHRIRRPYVSATSPLVGWLLRPGPCVPDDQRGQDHFSIYGTPNQDHTYGFIAYVPNLTSTGHVLLVGGLNTAGTETATTFLLTPSLVMPTLQRARIAHGGFQPFELLIGAANVATNASAPQLVLERIGSPLAARLNLGAAVVLPNVDLDRALVSNAGRRDRVHRRIRYFLSLEASDRGLPQKSRRSVC